MKNTKKNTEKITEKNTKKNTEKDTEKQLDRRQRKTRAAIQTALMELMKDKPLEKITISKLAETADVNRKTFYNHYNSIDEVRLELEQQYVDLLFSFVTEEDVANADPVAFIGKLINAMVEEPVRARLVFESGESLYLAKRMKKIIEPALTQIITSRHQPTGAIGYAIEYVVYGTLAVLNSWIHGEYTLTPEEVENVIISLISSNAAMLEK